MNGMSTGGTAALEIKFEERNRAFDEMELLLEAQKYLGRKLGRVFCVGLYFCGCLFSGRIVIR